MTPPVAGGDIYSVDNLDDIDVINNIGASGMTSHALRRHGKHSGEHGTALPARDWRQRLSDGR